MKLQEKPLRQQKSEDDVWMSAPWWPSNTSTAVPFTLIVNMSLCWWWRAVKTSCDWYIQRQRQRQRWGLGQKDSLVLCRLLVQHLNSTCLNVETSRSYFSVLVSRVSGESADRFSLYRRRRAPPWKSKTFLPKFRIKKPFYFPAAPILCCTSAFCWSHICHMIHLKLEPGDR